MPFLPPNQQRQSTEGALVHCEWGDKRNGGSTGTLLIGYGRSAAAVDRHRRLVGMPVGQDADVR